MLTAMTTRRTTRLSVVLTAHNASRTLLSCLDALQQQETWATGELEIIVVDDRSTDGTSELARSRDGAAMTVLRLSEYCDFTLTARQLALEAGMRQACGDVVLVLDADARVATDWCAALARPVLSGRADLVAGGVAFDARASGRAARVVASLQTVDAAYYLYVCRGLNAVGLPSGMLFGSAALGRRTIEKVGGFRRIGHALTEDLAFARAAKAGGGRMAFSLPARVRVEGCESFSALVRRAVRTSAGGRSVLAAVLGAWMLLLPLTAVLAVIAGGGWWLLLAARYGSGTVLALSATVASGEWRRAAYAFVYEPVSIAIGGCALVAVRCTNQVEWGGIRYDRHRRRSATA